MSQVIGQGGQLKLETSTGPSVYTTIADVTSIKPAPRKVKSIPRTHLTSTAHEYRPGLPDPGELEIKFWYDPAETTHTTLEGLANAPALKNWKIVYPDDGDAEAGFAGFLVEFDPGELMTDEGIEGSVKIQVTGPITTTP